MSSLDAHGVHLAMYGVESRSKRFPRKIVVEYAYVMSKLMKSLNGRATFCAAL